MTEKIFTIGHSTHAIEEFIAMLEAHGVKSVIDVRTIPKSRHNPQFAEDALAESLARQDIGYRRMESLGGLRHTTKETINGAWKNASFRGYADYMQTPEFAAGVDELMKIAMKQPTTIMCAEAVPWRCHRSLIGDARQAVDPRWCGERYEAIRVRDGVCLIAVVACRFQNEHLHQFVSQFLR